MRAVRGFVFGALLGVVLGVLARSLMRLVAIGMAIEPELNVGASIAIVSLFVVAGSGAGAARALDVRTWQRALLVVLSSAPLLVMGTTFAVGEIVEILDLDLTLPWTIELMAMSAVILGTALVTPYAGWRAGRRAARRGAPGG